MEVDRKPVRICRETSDDGMDLFSHQEHKRIRQQVAHDEKNGDHGDDDDDDNDSQDGDQPEEDDAKIRELRKRNITIIIEKWKALGKNGQKEFNDRHQHEMDKYNVLKKKYAFVRQPREIFTMFCYNEHERERNEKKKFPVVSGNVATDEDADNNDNVYNRTDLAQRARDFSRLKRSKTVESMNWMKHLEIESYNDYIRAIMEMVVFTKQMEKVMLEIVEEAKIVSLTRRSVNK